MKRVRYLAGAVGIAPLAMGALTAAPTPANAEVASHGKTVSLHAAAGHQAGITPDIRRVSCYYSGVARVFYGFLGPWFSTCFASAGAEHVNIIDFHSMDTGNNGVFAIINESGRNYYCLQSYKWEHVNYGSCADGTRHLNNSFGTMTHISIFPGR
jgi:hypothetical protein